MKKRVSKLIVSFTAVLCLAVGFCVSASADVVGGAGLLGSALGSLGVDLLAGGSATMAMLAPWLSEDFSIMGALTGVADGYIKVGDESVIIDGVQYESIYLDPSMAAELHTQAFDFITQKAITSNSSGILAAGAGVAGNVPLYNVNGVIKSQVYTSDNYGGISDSGLFNVQLVDVSTTSYYARFLYNSGSSAGQSIGSTNTRSKPYLGAYFRQVSSTYGNVYVVNTPYNDYSVGNLYYSDAGITVDTTPFDYSYVSGVIDATPLPSTWGFQSFVPTQTLAQAGFTPGTYVIDGGTGTDDIIELIQLLDELYGQNQVKDSEFVEEIVPPVPPQPIDTPLGEVPYEDFLDTFGQSIYGKLDSISDGIDTVGLVVAGAGSDVIDAVDTVGQSIVDELGNVTDTVDTVGQAIEAELESVEGAIDTAGQSVVDAVEEGTGVLEQAIEAVEAKVDELVDSIAEVIEEIMTHPLDLFSAWLDRLPEIPAIKDIFDGIKRHVGIWHYVVEWLGCIGTFLAFFIGLFGDVAYCMVVPIYACVAGAICLAFYKRFAR